LTIVICAELSSTRITHIAEVSLNHVNFSMQAQTRSADEPMTTFVLCYICGNRWKVYAHI